MRHIVLIIIGCAAGYIQGGYFDALTGDDQAKPVNDPSNRGA